MGFSYLGWGGEPGDYFAQWRHRLSPPPAAEGPGGCATVDPIQPLNCRHHLCICTVTSACPRSQKKKKYRFDNVEVKDEKILNGATKQRKDLQL